MRFFQNKVYFLSTESTDSSTILTVYDTDDMSFEYYMISLASYRMIALEIGKLFSTINIFL